MAKRGLFITFEGIDGCGKSTQLEKLKEYLTKKNYNVITTLEPGGCEIGKSLRQILLHHKGFVSNMAELFMYLADRSQHIEEIVLENINKGNIVLCDRHIDSTVAYQGYGRGYDIKTVELLNNIATNNYKPDLTFVFDIDIKTAQKRIGLEKDRLESLGNSFHQKVRNGYLELSKKEPKRIKVINSNRAIEEIALEVQKIVDEIL